MRREEMHELCVSEYNQSTTVTTDSSKTVLNSLLHPKLQSHDLVSNDTGCGRYTQPTSRSAPLAGAHGRSVTEIIDEAVLWDHGLTPIDGITDSDARKTLDRLWQVRM